MKRTLALTALIVLATAGCSSSNSAADPKPARATPRVDAASALKAISATVSTAKQNSTITAASDPNHLLGRPGQYTSKVTFADSRVSKADAAGFKAGDVELGGAIEAFANSADAAARAEYIRSVTKSSSALAEYDYVHGAVVVRVSRFLTPTQAGQYKTAAAKLS
ncbi:hypothetical protein [Streptomyces sp. NPDC019937]|uniref:hypothetical protein n=1 Tax=Streptomyces sp. NPDC019937 TaxID=3154787 RepID=UPI0033EC2319